MADKLALNLSTADFNNVDNINRFAGLLITVGNSLGVLNSHVPLQTKDAVAVYQTAKRWTDTVKRLMPAMTPSDALSVIDAYEIIYRIAYWHNADSEEINTVKLTAFDAMVHGDKRVDEYIMFRAIRKAIRQKDKAYFDKPLTWSCISLERWHNEASCGYEHYDLSDYDILSRVSILLESDIFAYEGRDQMKFKKRLFEQHRHYLYDYNASDWRLMLAVNNFLIFSYKFLSEDEFEKYKKNIDSKCHEYYDSAFFTNKRMISSNIHNNNKVRKYGFSQS